MALALVPAGAAEGHALVEGDVVADLRGLADDDAHAMVDEEAPADLRPRMDLDAGEPAPEVGHQARQPLPAGHPQGMSHAVQPDGMEARITGEHLEGIARSRVTVEYALNVFSHAFEHHLSLRFCISPRAAFWVSVRMPRRIFISSLLMPLRP
ncbi:hypothetical protein FQZ97_796010 [compost metagenome]